MSKALENWDANRADATDALVALVRTLIPESSDKTKATEAIYAHVRALREGGERMPQRFVCRDHGFGVKGDTDGCCAGCGKDCLVVEAVYIPEDWGPLPGACGVVLNGEPDDPDGAWECSLLEGHTGDHVDGDNGHSWAQR